MLSSVQLQRSPHSLLAIEMCGDAAHCGDIAETARVQIQSEMSQVTTTQTAALCFRAGNDKRASAKLSQSLTMYNASTGLVQLKKPNSAFTIKESFKIPVQHTA